MSLQKGLHALRAYGEYKSFIPNVAQTLLPQDRANIKENIYRTGKRIVESSRR